MTMLVGLNMDWFLEGLGVNYIRIFFEAISKYDSDQIYIMVMEYDWVSILCWIVGKFKDTWCDRLLVYGLTYHLEKESYFYQANDLKKVVFLD